jgi:hypothetical protein
MSNLNNSFVEFNKKIKLSDEDRKKLLANRESLRKRMRENYSKLPKEVRRELDMKFQSQGSYVMDTIIKPIKEDYDLDDGVYFVGQEDKAERQEPSIFHEWVKHSVDRDESYEEIIEKDTCLRVKYKNRSHIDLPIYYFKELHPDLAHIKKGWTISDPIEFIAWFEEKVNSGFQRKYLTEYGTESTNYKVWLNDMRKKDVQIRRIVRYLKAWADNIGGNMPCGLILTIFVADHYQANDRDDLALRDTLFSIYDLLSRDGVHCYRPTTPVGEDLFENTPEADKRYFLESLEKFWMDASNAINASSPSVAQEIWSYHLGERFKLSELDNITSRPSQPSPESLKPLIKEQPWFPKSSF